VHPEQVFDFGGIGPVAGSTTTGDAGVANDRIDRADRGFYARHELPEEVDVRYRSCHLDSRPSCGADGSDGVKGGFQVNVVDGH
jgi:hypothetical protein